MCKVQMLRALVEQRLTAAAEEIFGLFERTIAEYEEELCRSKEENERQRELLDAVFNPQLRVHRPDLPPNLLEVIIGEKEQKECSSSVDQLEPEPPPHIKEEQQECSTSVDQQEQEPPPHIKEEQDERWSSQEEEQLQGLEEADITKFPFTPVPVKIEDDEEEAQSSQLHQRHTQHMETEADGEDCGGPEPARNSHPLLQPETEHQTGDSSEPETDDSADWKETREPQSALNSLKHDSRCKKTFSCSECGRRFGRKGHLKRHMITHTGEKPFSCSECGKAFTESGTLKRHIKTHTGERPYTCSVCKKSFTQRGSLRSHMVVVHTGEKPFSCPVCQLSFSRRQYLQRHLIIHKGGRLPCCSVCSKGFTSSGNLKRHMMTHTGERPFSCSVCKKSFSERGGLKRHMITHKNKKPISSLECGTESSRVKIQLINHTGEKLFSCSVCQKSFTQRDRLQRHVRIHTGEKKYSCNSCEQTFAWSTSLKIHQCLGRQPETGDQTGDSSDPEADDSADWKETREPQSALNSLKHDSRRKKTFSCSECGGGFAKRGHLLDHIRIHSGERPFSCSVCQQSFKQSGHLYKHMSIHRKEGEHGEEEL
ncbi:gastrula zinc finger protein XlCGF57.1 isoform X2 [Etheostoma spectabile]|uniref:gastrula zinc finger protein XlCGF57.1 isoform X2 n=1 Tax=Etheostoma spectabile TaxID=54343 RepID=UPI0013AF21EA|nr:gastrula zinc finger protein XlCGF57.1-like isoform X2 [Etheostoma spectabile]